MTDSIRFNFKPTDITKISFREFRKRYGDVITAGDVHDDYKLLLIKGLMVHSDVRNGNGMGFKEEDLKEVLEQGLFQPPRFGIMDYEHNFVVHGIWFNAKEVEDEGTMAIETEGVFFAWLYPSMAEEILGRYQMGKLYFSMAAIPSYIECSKCGHTIEWPLPFDRELAEKKMCKHMKKVLLDRDLESEDAIMYLRKPLFVANSIVRNPADEDAEAVDAPQVTNANIDIEANRFQERSYQDVRPYVFVTAEKVQEIINLHQSHMGEEVNDMGKDMENEDVVISAKLKVLRSNSGYLKKLPIEADARWSFTAKDGNAIIDKGGMALFKKVHLAMDADGDPDLKGTYHFPVAKLSGGRMKIFRRGVIAAKVRAAQWKYDEVVKFASSLLEYIDKKLEKAGIEVVPVEEIEAELIKFWEENQGGDIMETNEKEQIKSEVEETKDEKDAVVEEEIKKDPEVKETEAQEEVKEEVKTEEEVTFEEEKTEEKTDEVEAKDVEEEPTNVEKTEKSEADKIKELYAMLWAEKLNNKFGIEVTAEEKALLANFTEEQFNLLMSMIQRIVDSYVNSEVEANEVNETEKKEKETASKIIENVTGNVPDDEEDIPLKEQMERFKEQVLKMKP